MLNFEKLETSLTKGVMRSDSFSRAKVPGGWLIAHYESTNEGDSFGSLCFYPDPDHSWDGSSVE